MSVLIKGMETPQACFWRDKNDSLIICPLYDADGYCGADGKQRCLVPENEMPNDCPLIELPPHGRLIDADALIDDGWLLVKSSPYIEYTPTAVCYDSGVVSKRIADVPTILEAEVGE